MVVANRKSRDCLVVFEGCRHSVTFRWVDREVKVTGTLHHVGVRGAAAVIVRHPWDTRALLVLDPDH